MKIDCDDRADFILIPFVRVLIEGRDVSARCKRVSVDRRAARVTLYRLNKSGRKYVDQSTGRVALQRLMYSPEMVMLLLREEAPRAARKEFLRRLMDDGGIVEGYAGRIATGSATETARVAASGISRNSGQGVS